MLLFHLPLATAQVSAASTGLELQAGYGGGGSHADGLVGGGVAHRFGASVEGTAFFTAAVARRPGRAVFAGTGARLMPLHGRVWPYVALGPLLAVRSYAEGRLGGFAALGLEAAIAGSDQCWRAFMEGRVMHGGGSWTQLVGGVRVSIR